MSRSRFIANGLLLTTFIVGYIPVLFYGYTDKISISPFVQDCKSGYWVSYFYADSINHIQLVGAMLLAKYLDKRLVRFIFCIVVLDLVHLFFLAGKGFVYQKLTLALGITLGYEYLYKRFERS